MRIESPDEARQRLGALHPDAETATMVPTAIARVGWFLTYGPGEKAPPGAPSFLVLTDGRVGPVNRLETIRDAYERLVAEPAVD